MSETSVEFQIQTEIESNNEQVKQLLINKLDEFHSKGFKDKDREKRQKEIINNLPSDFYLEISSLKYLSSKTDSPLQKQIAGYLFEELIRADDQICKDEETDTGKVLRSIMHNPDRYQLKFGYARNPDLARVNEETGEVQGWVEAKSGHLDKRCLDQLLTFDTNFDQLIAELNILKKDNPQLLLDHGLSNIINLEEDLKLAQPPWKILAVPYHAFNDDVNNLLSPDILPSQKIIFKDIINTRTNRSKGKYTIRESPFSKKEIGQLTDLLVELDKNNWQFSPTSGK